MIEKLYDNLSKTEKYDLVGLCHTNVKVISNNSTCRIGYKCWFVQILFKVTFNYNQTGKTHNLTFKNEIQEFPRMKLIH